MPLSSENLTQLAANIRTWGKELGFQQVGITDIDLAVAEDRLNRWLDSGYHGEMHYMECHGNKRSRPELLVEYTRRVISVRMVYLPDHNEDLLPLVEDPALAYVTRYALGRDYHKLMRRRLAQLAKRIKETIGQYGHRVFVDSAPVLEKPLAEKAGLGWIGKHTNLINLRAGSWFFLDELYTDLPLPADDSVQPHCGTCNACIEVCPTRAITFGDIADEKSEVTRHRASPLNYSVLGELTTQPRTTYLARVRNPNPRLAGEHESHGAHGHA